MGIVREVGAETGELKVGDRVVVPFNISCGHCWMCSRGLFAQCETTQVRSEGKGASLFGYTSLYGSVPGGQAQYLRARAVLPVLRRQQHGTLIVVNSCWAR